jgi:hypothetical protein
MPYASHTNCTHNFAYTQALCIKVTVAAYGNPYGPFAKHGQRCSLPASSCRPRVCM